MQSLFNTLKEELQLSDKKIEYFVSIIESIIKNKTVNLDKIAEIINPNNTKSSNYRILQRFFKDFNFIFTYFAKLLMNTIPEGKKILAIDRTEWNEINIFFLCVEYEGVGIPILWQCLDKKGCTNTLERESLIEDYINIFGKDNIDYMTADREFIGKDWFNWLKEQKIPFLIRLKSNFILENGLSYKKKIKGIFRYYVPKEKLLKLFGIELRIMGKRINKKDLLVVATNSDELFIEDYSNRWMIETMFSCFKTRGFNLESTKMKDNYKIDKLVALISIAYCWCIKVGKYFKNKDSKIRKTTGYSRKSFFKIGAESITTAIIRKTFDFKFYLKYTAVFSSHNNLYSHSVVA